ncbi:MAG: glycosyltransferase [Acidobacteria bacterium]|nr:glycosyltransferase [Acidobacteriota bacterium]
MSVPTSRTATDIIVPVYNQYSFTRNLIESIYRHTDVPFHIYLIDNASTDETVDLHKVYTRNITVVHNQKNKGWCGGINQGVELGENPNVVFMNNDVEVSTAWLGNLVGFLNTHPRIGAVGPLNSNPNDLQFIDRIRKKYVPQIPDFMTDDLHERNRILKYHFEKAGIMIEGMLSFFCVAMKRRTVNEIGPLDENYVTGGDDEDYCRRLRKAGFVLGLSLETYVIHHSSLIAKTIFESTVDNDVLKRKRARLK